MCFNAAMPSLLKTRWVAGARGGSQSDLLQIQEENKYWPPDRGSTLPSTDCWINLLDRQTKKPM